MLIILLVIKLILLRTFLLIIIIFVLFKLIGKKQISQMNSFDYILGITIGSLVADISLDLEKNILFGIGALCLYCLFSIIVSYVSIKNSNLRRFLVGDETLIINNGKILRNNLAKCKITINDLEREARLAGYFRLDEINMAYFEANGQFSFELKEKEKPISKKDIGLKSHNNGLVYNLIIDGKIIKDNLHNANVSEKWIRQQVSVHGKKIEDILLLTVDNDKNIIIYD